MSSSRRPPQRGNPARPLVIALAFAGLALLAMLGIADAGGALDFTDSSPLTFVAYGVAAVGIGALWWVADRIRGHMRAVEGLRGALVSLEADDRGKLPAMAERAEDGELAQIHDALERLLERLQAQQSAPDRRLEAVLASIGDAIVVITGEGQVSLVNHAAKVLLGADDVAVGSSVYAALSRTTVRAAMAQAVSAGRPVDAMIGTLAQHQLAAKVAVLEGGDGAVLIIPAEEITFRAEIESDLSLLDRPPPAAPIADDLALERLPILVFDTETTGLDVANDRIVSIGAVRMAGARIYRGVSFDRLVDPRMEIPALSTSIHGITDEMVRDADPFPAVYDHFRPHLHEVVAVGHQVAFDMAMLRHECALAGLDWAPPPSLDTCLLASVMEPLLPGGHGLEAVADWLGVEIHGRHTALGDSLVTAEVFARMVPRLIDRGITTFGQAKAFESGAKSFLQEQKKAGW